MTPLGWSSSSRRLLFWELTEQGSVRATQRSLARLYQAGLVERLDRRVSGLRPGSSAFLWRLSSAGARLAMPERDRWRRREPGLAHLAHVLEVAEIVVGVTEESRGGGFEVVEIQTEPDCWRDYTTGWGARRILKPDLRVTIATEAGQVHRFVEVDRGTEHRPVLSRKIDAYLRAWRGGGEQVRAGVFPLVLWIVPIGRRAEVVADLCRRSGVRAMFEVAVRSEAARALTASPGTAGSDQWKV